MRQLIFSVFFLCCLQASKAQPYPIGTQTITYQDPARSNRNIQTYLYYPATSAGASTAVAAGSFPIVVIGHGFVMTYSSYTLYADTLTPQGYIVAIVNTETGVSPSHTNYGLDLAFIVAKLYAENNNPASPFYQHVTQNSCVMGHSMGGGCTILGAANNANVTCTATFALAETNPSAIAAAANVTAPSLVFSGSDDCVAPAAGNQTPVYNNLPGCKSFVSIVNGGHCGFASSNFNCNFGEMSCNPGGPSLSASAQQAIVFKLLRPWLDRFLYNNTAAGTLYAARLAALAAQNSITFINPCASLAVPIELARFDVSKIEKEVLIEWETGVESKLSHFSLEKSGDGLSFFALIQQKPQGAGFLYQFLDKEPLTGPNYYRLKAIDDDGSIEYSPIRRVYFYEDPRARLWPNPSMGRLNLKLDENEETPSRLWVYDLNGRQIDLIYDGENAWIFPVSLPNGLYRCHWMTEGGLGSSVNIFLQRDRL